eukprot:gene7653-8957_t
MSEVTKILVCGDVGGSIDALFKRVATIDKSAGPFKMLLCVGSFFEKYNNAAVGKDDAPIRCPEELEKYRAGVATAPIPTYFIANTPRDLSYLADLADASGKVAENIIYLGKTGIREISGLNIAYLSGSVSHPVKDNQDSPLDPSITKLDIEEIKQESLGKPIDILLTNQWPRGVLNHLSTNLFPKYLQTQGSNAATIMGMDGIKEIVKSLSPFYHFSKGQEYYQRLPYVNARNAVTKFLSLAPVYNEKKEKYIFAMSYSRPADNTPHADATPFPFIDREPSNKNQRTNSANNPRGGNRDGQPSNENRQGNKRNRPQETPCWFCLSSPEVESHLIVTIGSEAYLALPKGGIVMDNSLVVFIEHKPSYVSLADSERADVDKLVDGLRTLHAKEDKVLVVYERFINLKFSTQLHGHIQVVPIPIALQDKLQEAFTNHAEFQNVTMNIIDTFEQFKKDVGDNQYFSVMLPNGKYMYVIVEKGAHFDFQFGRQVLCDLLGTPERLNWKECALSKEEEEKQTVAFRERFEPYYEQ